MRMKNIKVLFVGFGIVDNRREAVSINTKNLVTNLKSMGIEVKTINIGYSSTFPLLSMLFSVINRPRIIRNIASIIEREKVTHVYDTFVMPGASLLFIVPLISRFPKVRFIKEIHNDYGYPVRFEFESVVRFVLNRKEQINKLLRLFDKVVCRNRYLAKKFNTFYLPPYLSLEPRPSIGNQGKYLRVCFLGHPLRKKGIDLFLDIFRNLPEKLMGKLSFSFAFSDIANSGGISRKIIFLSKRRGIKVRLYSKVDPYSFFRKNDVLLLPLLDKFGASGSLNTILEAMEAGCLVVTTKLDITQAILENMKTGILVDRPDSKKLIKIISDILEHRIEIKNLRMRARSYIITEYSKFNLEIILNKIFNE